jgi:predicted ATPase
MLAVENYRSLRSLVLPLAPLTVVTGANGVGKSSLYRALRLLADAARNGAVAALAREGGLPSTLWAGPETIGLLVLNEPETSLHEQLLAPLGQLIAAAATRSQVVAVSHAQPLIAALREAAEDAGTAVSAVELIKDFGETQVRGRDPLDGPNWRWPKR